MHGGFPPQDDGTKPQVPNEDEDYASPGYRPTGDGAPRRGAPSDGGAPQGVGRSPPEPSPDDTGVAATRLSNPLVAAVRINM